METDNLYVSGRYLELNPTWHVEQSGWKADHVYKMLHLLGVVPKSICDVGCGAGGVLRRLRDHYPECQLTGFDISPQAIKIARDLVESSIDVRVGNATTEIVDQHFDVALALDVFEHVEDFGAFLRGIQKIAQLKIFHIPLDMTVEAVLRPSVLKNRLNGAGHLHYFNKDTALAALTRGG